MLTEVSAAMGKQPTVISTFCGAGGMDIGFISAGHKVLFASDWDHLACETYGRNIGTHVVAGDVAALRGGDLPRADILIGGPPCQGFSVAGHMRPDDPRSQLVWQFVRLVRECAPKIFVMENVKALAKLERFGSVRAKLLRNFAELGYETNMILLNAADFGVPQSRERVFFIGVRQGICPINCVPATVKERRTVRHTIGHLPPPGIAPNLGVCRARVVVADHPVLRKSPYAGMLFNGQGRPIALDDTVNTLPASMGGNRTPVIDEGELRHGQTPWIAGYHQKLLRGAKPGGSAPARLRRITVTEAALLQTFPEGFEFAGSQSAQYRQIGNAVPPKLAEGVARVVAGHLAGKQPGFSAPAQCELFAGASHP
jgi:DNA (cytosine-5)-methyltransferase 1